jgi:peptide/nickel transport system permease protein
VSRGLLERAARLPIGGVLVAGYTLAGLLGPLLAPYDPESIDLRHQYAPPSALHLLGTADNGVDILSVLLHGARLGLVVSASVVGVSVVIGTTLGVLAGYYGGRADRAFTSLADLVQAFPSIVLNIAILAVIARPGVMHVILALAANGWVLYARIARAQALSLRDREFVQAARAIGAHDARVLCRHVVPNLLGPLVVQATAGLGGVVLAESTLSFLGLGPSTGASWGALLDQGSAVLLRFPHVALFAGGAIALTVLGFNLAGDRLRDRLDPRNPAT